METSSDPESIEVSGFWGSIKAHGHQVFSSLLFLCLGGMALYTYYGHQEILKYETWQAERQTEEHKNMIEAAEHMRREMQFQTWMLSLPPDERPKIIPPDWAWERLEAQTYKELENRATQRLLKQRERLNVGQR